MIMGDGSQAIRTGGEHPDALVAESFCQGLRRNPFARYLEINDIGLHIIGIN